MNDLTEKSLKSEQLLDGVLLKVHRDRVRLPDGGESVREWIDHPGAAAVVPIRDDGMTILVNQYRFPPRRQFLEVPAGKIDVFGEDPSGVARRELEEETGWRSDRLTHMASLYPCIGYSNEIIHFFLAEDLVEGQKSPSHGEFLDEVLLPFASAVQMALAGEIRDMKTVTALLLARNFVNSRSGSKK